MRITIELVVPLEPADRFRCRASGRLLAFEDVYAAVRRATGDEMISFSAGFRGCRDGILGAIRLSVARLAAHCTAALHRIRRERRAEAERLAADIAGFLDEQAAVREGYALPEDGPGDDEEPAYEPVGLELSWATAGASL